MYKQKQIWVPKRDFRKTVILNAATQANESKETAEGSTSKQMTSEVLTSSVSFVQTHRRRTFGSRRRNQLRKEDMEFAKEEWQDYLDNLDMSDDPREYLRAKSNIPECLNNL